MKTFGENLQKLLDENNLTIRSFAKKIKIPYKTVADWVASGSRMPRNPDHIKAIADYFNCSTHYILFGEDDPHGFIGEILEKTEIHSGLYEISIKKVKTKNK